MPSRNEPNAKGDADAKEFQHAERESSGTQADGTRRQPWGIPFALFLSGFVLLVVLAKLNLARVTADVLRGAGVGLCIAAFVIARRGQRAAR